MYVMGIDSGSTSTNAVIMDGDRKIVASAVWCAPARNPERAPSGFWMRCFPKRA